MKERISPALDVRRGFLLATAGVAALAVPIVVGALTARRLQAQAPSTQSPALPEWQNAAGNKLAFDVASVKLNNSGSQSASMNIPLLGDIYTPTGGLFSGTNVPLISYIYFAYNVRGSQMQLLLPQLPKWVIADHFDIQARADGNPTKEQMRGMMQSLLADRFKLAVHYETRQLPVFAALLLKPGKTGPQLRPHSSDAPCSTIPPTAVTPGSAPTSTVAGGFPTVCGGIVGMPASAPGRMRTGARNVPIGTLVSALAQMGNLDRSVSDETGLSGTFDFTFEWTPERRSPEVGSQADDSGPTFLEALREQLGLKLESKSGPVDVFVIDHIDHPSEN